jgi:hypothetical protein
MGEVYRYPVKLPSNDKGTRKWHQAAVKWQITSSNHYRNHALQNLCKGRDSLAVQNTHPFNGPSNVQPLHQVQDYSSTMDLTTIGECQQLIQYMTAHGHFQGNWWFTQQLISVFSLQKQSVNFLIQVAVDYMQNHWSSSGKQYDFYQWGYSTVFIVNVAGASKIYKNSIKQ